jgi:hypothetical protein
VFRDQRSNPEARAHAQKRAIHESLPQAACEPRVSPASRSPDGLWP